MNGTHDTLRPDNGPSHITERAEWTPGGCVLNRRLRLIATMVIAASVMLIAGPVAAQTDIPVDVTVTPATGVNPGDELVVTASGIPFPPDGDVFIATCWVFPVRGPADCYVADFGLYLMEIQEDETGEALYVAPPVADRCSDPDTEDPCLIVVSSGIGPQSTNGATPILYDPPADATTTTTTAPTTTTTVAETTTTTVVAAPADDESSNTVAIAIGAGLLVVLAGGLGFALGRRTS